MTKLSDEFLIRLSLEDASLVCRSAISSIGWNIKSVESQRIVPKVGVGMTRNASRIEVLLSQEGEARTTVRLNGSIGEIGPLQRSHLNGRDESTP